MPIITGPQLFNFTQIADWLRQANALTIVNNETEFVNSVIRLLQDKKLRLEQGQRAYEVVQRNHGALQNHLRAIEARICEPKF